MGINNVQIGNIPDKAFIVATRKRDIQKASILSVRDRKNIPNGSFDVHLESPLGECNTISRAELVRGYVYLSGKRIRISDWKANRTYMIMREDNTEVLALKIPTGYRVQIGNKSAQSVDKVQNYIVCLKGENNELNRDTASIVSRGLFRKMFTISEEVLKAFLSGKTERGVKGIKSRPEKTNIVEHELVNKVESKEVQRSTVKTKEPISYNAIGRLVASDGTTVGFIIKGSNGMTKQVSKQEITVLCARKLISNITLATKEGTGNKFLRGNGIKISDLPATAI